MELTRREMLKLGMLGSAALFLPLERVARTALSNPLTQPFQAGLPIPKMLKPVKRTATTDFYRVVQRERGVEIIPGLKTDIWGYNSMFPDPTIVTRRGRRMVVEHVNDLPVSNRHPGGGKGSRTRSKCSSMITAR